MSVVFLVAFVAGLLIAVFAMLHGVERRQVGASGVTAVADPAVLLPQARVNVPLLAAFFAIAGATGYLLSRYTTLSVSVRVAIACAVGISGAFGAVALVTKWALPSAARDVEDPRYVLQGRFARVTHAISASSPGAVQLEMEGGSHSLRASSLDGSTIGAGQEVVIDRVEDDVAFVELWTRVEERL